MAFKCAIISIKNAEKPWPCVIRTKKLANDIFKAKLIEASTKWKLFITGYPILHTKMHCAYQSETESSDGAMMNRWRQDSHYQALTWVWVCCGSIALCPRQSLRQTLPSQLLFKKKKNRKDPNSLNPNSASQNKEKTHSDSQVYRSAVVTPKKSHCLTFMTLPTIVRQQSLTQHLANS